MSLIKKNGTTLIVTKCRTLWGSWDPKLCLGTSLLMKSTGMKPFLGSVAHALQES